MSNHIAIEDVYDAYERLNRYGIRRDSSMADIDACSFAIMREKGIGRGREDLAAVQKLKQVSNRLSIDFLTEPSSSETLDEATVNSIAEEICNQPIPNPREYLEQMGISPLQIAQQHADSQLKALDDSLSERKNSPQKIHYKPELSIDDFIRELLCQNQSQRGR